MTAYLLSQGNTKLSADTSAQHIPIAPSSYPESHDKQYLSWSLAFLTSVGRHRGVTLCDNSEGDAVTKVVLVFRRKELTLDNQEQAARAGFFSQKPSQIINTALAQVWPDTLALVNVWLFGDRFLGKDQTPDILKEMWDISPLHLDARFYASSIYYLDVWLEAMDEPKFDVVSQYLEPALDQAVAAVGRSPKRIKDVDDCIGTTLIALQELTGILPNEQVFDNLELIVNCHTEEDDDSLYDLRWAIFGFALNTVNLMTAWANAVHLTPEEIASSLSAKFLGVPPENLEGLLQFRFQ